MNETRLTGNGAPTRRTVGIVGQHYEDLNTGNIYECLVSSEHSKLHGEPIGGYVWQLKASGEDREDHDAIYGGGSGLPTGGAPYQQLVTDADGNAKWEDRTHRKEVTRNSVLFPSTVCEFATDSTANIHSTVSPLEVTLTGGESYEITIDGVSYVVTAIDNSGFILAGDQGLLQGASTDENLPFLAMSTNGQTFIGLDSSKFGLGGHTVEIASVIVEYYALPGEYLPYDLNTPIDISFSVPDGGGSGIYTPSITFEEAYALPICALNYRLVFNKKTKCNVLFKANNMIEFCYRSISLNDSGNSEDNTYYFVWTADGVTLKKHITYVIT